MTTDPDPTLRWMAAETLGPIADRVPIAMIERGASDPDDRVRESATRLAGSRGAPALPLLIRQATARRWPGSQLVALREIGRSTSQAHGLPPNLLDRLLIGIGAMDPPPMAEERLALLPIARALDVEVLAARLSSSPRLRVGAARLLALAGSPEALGLVAALTDDVPEIQYLRAAAVDRLGALAPDPEVAASTPEERVSAPAAAEEPDDEELIGALARALADPEESVREEARAAIRGVPRPAVLEWSERALGSADEARLACAVIELAELGELAAPVLEAAAGVVREDRAPYVRTLRSLALEGNHLADLVPALDPSVRAEAVRIVWQAAGRAALPSLVTLLGESAGAVRMAVLEVFQESGDPSVRTLAQELLRSDSSPAVRATAVHVLGPAAEPVRVAALRDALEDADPDVRATAVEVLPHRPTPAVMPLLLRALADPDERVWRAALRHLVDVPEREFGPLWEALKHGDADRMEELVAAMESSDPGRLGRLAASSARSLDPADRMLAVRVAARAGTQDSTQAVVGALSDPDPAVRRAAAVAMSTLRSPTAVVALEASLTDPQGDVRVEAVRALGVIDDDAVPDVLIRALRDPEIRVREMAAEALARWGSGAVAQRLVAALRSPDLRRPAGAVLERLGAAAVEPLVDLVAADDDEDAAAFAATLLGRVAGVDAFVAGAGSTDPQDRLRAVEVLGALGGPEAVEAIIARLRDPDVRVRTRAAALLGRMGEPKAIRHLRAMFASDPVVEVAAAAEAALRALGSEPTEERPLRAGEPEDPFGDAPP